jgi:hypothetical protein
MGIPGVTFTQADGNTGSTAQATTGVLAIIAFLSALPTNEPAKYTRVADMNSDGGVGPGLEYSAYYMNIAKKPVVILNPTTSTAGTYGTITQTGTGTYTVAAGATAPVDEYDITVKFIAGGTLGTTGITYQYTLDNGNNWSNVIALGTGTTVGPLALPKPTGANSNASFTLSTSGSSTVVAGDFFRVQTVRPQMQNSDLVTALAALAASPLTWDNVLVDVDVTSTFVATVDGWLTAIQAMSKYKMAWMNTRHKHTPAPTTESESAYLTALSTLLASTVTTQIDVGSDGAYCASSVSGLVQVRPTSMFIATRANGTLATGVDPAWIQLGTVPNCNLLDTSGRLVWHDERVYPGLDDLRFSTLCSVEGTVGTYIGNARILSNLTSDFQYDQHARTMNAAKTITYPLLTLQLSRGVRKQKPDPATGEVFILEDDAAAIEGFINPELESGLGNNVNQALFTLGRNDNLAPNVGAKVSFTLQLQSLGYIKALSGINEFVPAIQNVSSAFTSGVAGS